MILQIDLWVMCVFGTCVMSLLYTTQRTIIPK